ncbi:hypothetical protein [Sporosarcina aquimarina]|uniref:Uncharacterized protein n=1 Tax=Sporosarcina aquimarina TaxID=114975 RepID=A0ABU4G0W0_9BACL|nr:hypothetical protein [Sporosarcina aquimarina]MDW0110531.1 hypothetical protein [Sporosarcina aquimarina]
MQRQVSIKVGVAVLFVFLIGGLLIWYFIEKEQSFTTPQEAVLEVDPDLVLIPGYQLNNESLFFFINSQENLGAVYAEKGILGWKAGMLTSGTSRFDQIAANFNGFQSQDNLYYGVVELKDHQSLRMDDVEVRALNLMMMGNEIAEQYNLRGLYIWYVELEPAGEQRTLQLIDEDTGEVLDEMVIEA